MLRGGGELDDCWRMSVHLVVLMEEGRHIAVMVVVVMRLTSLCFCGTVHSQLLPWVVPVIPLPYIR